MTYHGDKRYYCVSCRTPVGKMSKLDHTRRGHILVGRPRRRRSTLKPVELNRVRFGAIHHWRAEGDTEEHYELDVLERVAGRKDLDVILQVDLESATLDGARLEAQTHLPKGAQLVVDNQVPEFLDRVFQALNAGGTCS